jgi:hypothetical protein
VGPLVDVEDQRSLNAHAYANNNLMTFKFSDPNGLMYLGYKADDGSGMSAGSR